MKNIRLLLIIILMIPALTFAQIDSVLSIQKINNVVGGLSGSPLGGNDRFGYAVEVIGDVDHDGVDDVAVGAYLDDDGHSDHGAVYILMLNADGTVKSQQKISKTTGGGPAMISGQNYFGSGIAALGDLNGDGNVDIAVGAYGGNDGGTNGNHGAVYILYLDNDGTVLEYEMISNNESGGPGTLSTNDYFGSAVTNVGDINEDGIPDLAIKAGGDDDGGSAAGAVYIGFLDYNGTLKDIQKISESSGSFGGDLDAGDGFGNAASIGDVNGDGITDIAFGAYRDDDGGTDRGAVWICFMNADGTVDSEQKISDTLGGFTGTLDDNDEFGAVVLGVNDLDGDGINELVVSAPNDDDGGSNEGAVWILYLNADGTVKSHDKISTTDAILSPEVISGDDFSVGLSTYGDRNNDGKTDLIIGAWYGHDGSSSTGEVYVTHLEGTSTYPNKAYHETTPYISSGEKHSALAGEPLELELGGSDAYGITTCAIGDLDGDGNSDMAVGAYGDDDGGTNRGAVYIQFLNADGSIKSYQKISDTQGGFTGVLNNSDLFGYAVTAIGDLDNDGITDIAVNAYNDDDGGTDRGAIWILFMTDSGYVKSHQKISDTQGSFTGTLDNSDRFGFSLTGPGDIDGDGIEDLVAGVPFDDDKASSTGALWVLFLDSNGTVKSHQKISDSYGNFSEVLSNGENFGYSVTTIGDMDGDGVVDLAAGARLNDDAVSNGGAAYVLFMTDSGYVKSSVKIYDGNSGFTGYMHTNDYFGSSIIGNYDFNKDDVNDILVGSYYKDDGGQDRGSVAILFMKDDGTVDYHKTVSGFSSSMTEKLDNSDYFGSSLAVIDFDAANNTAKIAIGAFKDDDGASNTGAVYVLEVKTHLPLTADYFTVPENSTRSGSIELNPKDGGAPYYYYWDDGDQSKDRYNLTSGNYTVTIVDTLLDSLELNIPVKMMLDWTNESDSLTTYNDVFEKSGAADWGNGLASLKNVVKGEGELNVTVDKLGKEWTFGFRLGTDTQSTHYYDLDYGFYINADDSLFSWEDSTLTFLDTLELGDTLSLVRQSDETYFKLNGTTLRQSEYDNANLYRIDFSAYTPQTNAGVGIVGPWTTFTTVTGVVTHNTICYSTTNGDGAIDITAHLGVICVPPASTTYAWTGPNNFTASTEDITGLASGTYSVVVTYCNNQTANATFEVGYDVNWKNIIGATDNGSALTNTASGYGTSGASSNNITHKPAGVTEWLEFSVSLDANGENELAVGLSDDDPDQQKTTVDYGLVFKHTTWNNQVHRYVSIRDAQGEHGTWLNGVTSFIASDVFRIEYDQTNAEMTYYKNGVQLLTPGNIPSWPYVAPPFVSTSVPSTGSFIVDAALADNGEGITSAAASFGCEFRGYPILKKKLDAGFFVTINSEVWFQYLEEYAPTTVSPLPTLDYKIYKTDRTLVASLPSKNITKIGANYYEADVSSLGLVSNTYYDLEVTNDKNEKFLLRFLYQ